MTDGLPSVDVNPNTGRLSTAFLTIGARADSYYEYLLKQWIQSGNKEKRYEHYCTATSIWCILQVS